LAPQAGTCWNTLGAARYRAGNWDGAIAALEKSVELRQGGDSFDWFFLAMARWRRGDQEQGRKWYAAAVLWAEKHGSENAELRRFRAEAAALLGLPETWLPVHDPAAGDEAVWAQVVEAAPGAAWAYTRRGEALALLERWDEAVADFAKAGALSPDEPVLHYRLALARLGAGDLAGYRSTCAALLDRFGQTEQPEAAQWVAWAAVLAPDAVSDRERPVQLGEAALRRASRSRTYATTLGAALYRAGRFGEAIQRLDEAAAAEQEATKPGMVSPAYARFFLAMAHARAGHAGKARRWLEEAIRGTEAEVRDPGDAASRTWNRRLTLRLLRQEAEDLVKEGSEARQRVHRFARMSEWKQASEAATRWQELEADEDPHLAWFYDSVLRLQLGDAPGYREVCHDMLTRFGQAKDPVIVERTARTCLLRPAAIDDLKPVFALAEQLVSGTKNHWARRWFLLTRGAAEYRAGNYAGAIDWLEKSMDAKEPAPQRDAFAALFLAMALHHQGQTGEARRRLNQAGRWLEERTRSLEPGDLGEEWSDWTRIEIVRREAEALLLKPASGPIK
jgi:tetratricopeptide (TPR) repeat protein